MRRLLLISLAVLALFAPVSAADSKGGAKTHAKASKAKSTKPKTREQAIPSPNRARNLPCRRRETQTGASSGVPRHATRSRGRPGSRMVDLVM